MTNIPTKKLAEDMPEVDLRDPRWKVVGRGRAAHRTLALPLAGIRKAARKTQNDVAAELDIHQGEVSRIEKRDDALLSTLERYAEAIGADLEVVFVFKTGARVTLAREHEERARVRKRSEERGGRR